MSSMQHLHLVLIGCSESLLPHVRRELSSQRAIIEGEFSDARRAAERLQPTQEGTRVFLVHVQASQGPNAITQLSGRFPGQPILALLDTGSDPAAILGALRAGATQIVPLPLQAEDFRAALDSIALYLNSSSMATVLAVCGAAGGCGTTMVAVNLAYEIACTHKLPCILLDLSLKIGTVATYLNVEPRYTTRDLLKNRDHLDLHMVRQVLTHVANDLEILAGPNAISTGEASPEEVLRIIEYTKQLAKVVVLDVPCTYDRLYFETAAAANQVLLIGEQKVPSIRAVSLVRDTLDRITSSLSQCLVVNRHDPKLIGFTTSDLEKLLKVSRIHKIANDAAVVAAVNNGRPLRLQAAKSQALADLGTLLPCLLGTTDPAQSQKQNLAMFRRVLHAVGVAS